MGEGQPMTEIPSIVRELPGKPRTMRVLVQRSSLAGPLEAVAAAREHGGSGWACLTDHVLAGPASELDEDALMLSAEFFDEQSRSSLSIRRSHGAWQAVISREISSDDPQGEAVLAFDDRLISMVDAASSGTEGLSYRTYWRRPAQANEDEPWPWAPWFSAFQGFAAAGGAS